MFEKLFGGGDRDRDRESRIRERMQGEGITEEEAARLVLSDEELAIGKREVPTGEVEIGKHVETEHVRESVPVRREEVVVERRPVTGGAAVAGVTLGQGEEIRIPLRKEEVIVEKRVVPKEELVVRKQELVENEVVEVDLRRERASVRRDDYPRGTDAPTSGEPDSRR